MTPQELQQVIEALRESQTVTLEKVVNGKIDKLDAKLDAHIIEHKADAEEIKGFLELTKGAKVLGEIGRWLGSIAIFGVALKWLFVRQ